MAVDTRDKRASSVAHGLPVARLLPLADGTVGVSDRLHLVWLYAGIAAGAAVAAPDRLATLKFGTQGLASFRMGDDADFAVSGTPPFRDGP